MTVTGPADILTLVADELATMRGEVDVNFLGALLALTADTRDPSGRLRAAAIKGLLRQAEHDSLTTWLPLPTFLVAGVMRTAATALEVSA